jgi:toxin secretion/phage lysis holin
MKNNNNIIEVILGALTGLGTYFCGLNWEIILIWGFLMTIDIISGVIKAMKKGTFASSDMKMGLFKKAGEFLLLLSLTLFQRVAEINGITMPIGSVFIGAFCFKELTSIIENCIDMDINLPDVVMNWFKAATNNQDKKTDTEAKK